MCKQQHLTVALVQPWLPLVEYHQCSSQASAPFFQTEGFEILSTTDKIFIAHNVSTDPYIKRSDLFL